MSEQLVALRHTLADALDMMIKNTDPEKAKAFVLPTDVKLVSFSDTGETAVESLFTNVNLYKPMFTV